MAQKAPPSGPSRLHIDLNTNYSSNWQETKKKNKKNIKTVRQNMVKNAKQRKSKAKANMEKQKQSILSAGGEQKQRKPESK